MNDNDYTSDNNNTDRNGYRAISYNPEAKPLELDTLTKMYDNYSDTNTGVKREGKAIATQKELRRYRKAQSVDAIMQLDAAYFRRCPNIREYERPLQACELPDGLVLTGTPCTVTLIYVRDGLRLRYVNAAGYTSN